MIIISTKQKRQLLFFGLSVLWASFIFYLSSQPNLASSFPPAYDFVLRKIAHIFVFAILAYFLANTFESHSRGHLFFVIIVVIFYALLDELRQSFVEGRHGSYRDITIDSVGVFIGILFYKFYPAIKFLKIK